MEKENLFKPKVNYKERYHQESLFEKWRKNEVLSLLLDSSLITQTNQKRVDIKLIDCGDYKQVYYSKKPHLKKDNNLDKMKDLHKICYEVGEKSRAKPPTTNELKKIELKNILRSKYEMQRLVKSNIKVFKTFTTLTFAENITSIKEANKIFNSWKTYIKKLKSDFKYICVPEFQQRGAIHYHLLTNIDYTDFALLSQEERRIWNKESGWQIGRDIKGWKYGLNMTKTLVGINVVSYISKYMTKDIDNRLWGHRRYLYSQNLRRPEIIELNLSNPLHFKMYIELVNENYELDYTNTYIDFLNNEVCYEEYKKVSC